MLRLKNLTILFCAVLLAALLFTAAPPTAQAQDIVCNAINAVDGWGIFTKNTPAELAFLVPEPPIGYVYAAQPAHTGYCEVFGMKDNHQPLPAQVCLTGSDNTVVGLYADQADLSRAWTVLPTEFQEGRGMCASLPTFGNVALLVDITQPVEGTAGVAGAVALNVPTDEEIEALRAQVGDGRICTITTTHRVNFRLSPGPEGEIANSVPVGTTIGAVAVQDGWFQLQWYYQMGWIDGRFVTAECLSADDLAAQTAAQAALQAAEEAIAAAQAAAEAAAAAAVPAEATEVPAE